MVLMVIVVVVILFIIFYSIFVLTRPGRRQLPFSLGQIHPWILNRRRSGSVNDHLMSSVIVVVSFGYVWDRERIRGPYEFN